MEEIDILRLIAAKNPALSKWMPHFVKKWLQRIIHEEEINCELRKYGHLHGLEFIAAALQSLGISYTTHGAENLTDTKGKLFISNHPLGGFDGIVLLDIIGRHNADVKAVVNDLLLHVAPLRRMFLPINKYGAQQRSHAQMLQQAYSSDAPILYFPAGLCSRRTKGIIADPEWHLGAMKIMRRYRRDVVPIYFEGRNTNFFYSLANVRKALGIRTNIETFLLPHELFCQRGAHFNVFVGQPIAYGALLQMSSLAAMTMHVREAVYSLKKGK
jgi:putative hemolysin